jgi:AcrR family transcriptional regulator
METVRDQRRREIITAARRIVAAEGLEGLTIAALEDKLGFTRGVITYHFDNKDEIVEAVLNSALEEIDIGMRGALAQAPSPSEAVKAVLQAMLRGYLEHPEAGRVLLSFWGRLTTDVRAQKANAALYARYRRQAQKLVGEGQKAGAFSASVSVEGMSALMVGVVLGLASQAYFEAGAFDVDAALGEATQALLARLTPR